MTSNVRSVLCDRQYNGVEFPGAGARAMAPADFE